ncbi:MAG: type II CRISPR RNA-guided endonuclease Cas9 [Planctomycetota bacterium]|nr:type II CRISPR RNA-guided endonuclease Cas9 [Planctomycetota bacterium]
MDKRNDFTLGLDIGTNSIGWAVIGCDADQKQVGLIGCGVRIFQESVDAKTKTPKNQARRAARSARRLVSRRKMRRNKILNILLQNKLLPEDAIEREKLFADNKLYDPYELRRRALDDKLKSYEFGRVLYHLSQRRGFQSNRKASSKEDGDVKKDITSLRQKMLDSKSRTLGEYLASQSVKRNRYTDRTMYQEEFEQIWQSQQKHYPDLLNPAFKVAIHNAIFFQRPLKIQKYLVGKCTFEPGRKRASRALLEYQRFRMLQDLNHLTIKNPITREYRPLANDERENLLRLLEKQKTLSWGAARKKLGLHEGEVFNLEEGKKKELTGNRTSYALRSILGKQWVEMTQEKQNDLVTDMLTIDNEQGFLNRMKSQWGFDNDTAEKLAKTELEQGYARLSRKAMCKILPYLEDGLSYFLASFAAYDPCSPDKKASIIRLVKDGVEFDKACKTVGYDKLANPKLTDELGEPPYLRNPVVEKAMYETRKLINAIIRQYGKPATIRIEMARDMKLTKRQKDELQKRQNDNKRANEKAEKILQDEFGIQNPTREDIQKYNMWLECKMICPYTGEKISREMLFSSEVDVEHILPYSSSLDDSYMNKTLCIAAENRAVKQNKTPYEAYHADTEKYLKILQQVKPLPWPKRKKFEQKEIDTDKCVTRQLNDTRYICVEVKKYLQQLGIGVEVSKGEATAALRHRWNLNRILARDGIIEKNREDHRHHAVDAVIIALTSRALFQKLSSLSAQSDVALSERGFHLDKPWPSFYEDVDEKIKNIIVSHAPSRKISGALHEETAYGYSEHEKCFVYRKPLSSLTVNEVEKIRDKKIKELAEERLAQSDGNLKKAFGDVNNPLLHVDGKTPIKTVRLVINLNPSIVYGVKNHDGSAYKFFKYGNNHHVEIIENIKTGNRNGIFVTALEAAKRARRDKTTIVQRDHGAEWRFIMSLAINDFVEIEQNGQKIYYRVQILDGSNKRITFRLHLAATLNEKNTQFVGYPNSLRCSKVTIDHLGNIYPCND